MAAAERRSEDAKKTKREEREDYDPRLDFYSEKFDPVLALQTPGIEPPVVDATAFDNLGYYESAFVKRPEKASKGNMQQVDDERKVERRWLPHQLPVPSKQQPPKRNILTRMENMKGPMSLLKQCKDERLMLKIWTRHSHGIRGYLTAYIVCFDKHWNLALEDVTEVWTRPKKTKSPVFDESHRVKREGSHRHIVPPQVTVMKSDKKLETCERRVKQLVIRGEQVALIAVIGRKENKDEKG